MAADTRLFAIPICDLSSEVKKILHMELHRIYLGTFVFINCLLIVCLINFERHQNYKIDMSKNISVNSTKH